MIRGYIVSVSEGSAAKRVGIGFGAGASELSVAVEAYQMTAQGLRRLGSGAGQPGAAKRRVPRGPGVWPLPLAPIGLVVGTGVKGYGELSGSSRTGGRIEQIVTEIAKHMEPRFRDQGWIK